jgi:hypothetical protein
VQYNFLSPTGATGTGAGGGSGPAGQFVGPRGPAGPIANTSFIPPIFDPQVYGALYWLPNYGNTGIFISNGVPQGVAKAGGL